MDEEQASQLRKEEAQGKHMPKGDMEEAGQCYG
jgi:hypothetical protein